MAPGYSLCINGNLIRTSEALYQACRFPHLPDVQSLIIDEISPMTAKMRSKPYRGKSRSDWYNVRIKIMKWCLRVKLTQNEKKFGELLLSTGDKPIVEESRRDAFWGAKRNSDNFLIGTNALGRLLMELREEIRSEGYKSQLNVSPPHIPQFLLFRRQIEICDKKNCDASDCNQNAKQDESISSTEEQSSFL